MDTKVAQQAFDNQWWARLEDVLGHPLSDVQRLGMDRTTRSFVACRSASWAIMAFYGDEELTLLAAVMPLGCHMVALESVNITVTE